MLFFKMENTKTGPVKGVSTSGEVTLVGWYRAGERGGYKERVKEAEYSGNIMYSCMKMEK
jgi:hypothetical protein